MFWIRVPEILFYVRQKVDESPGFTWGKLSSRDIFAGRRVVVFAVPAAHSPTCSSTHLPHYEYSYDRIRELGIDDVFCISVNDSFVMENWFKSLEIEKVKPLPDGSGDFTRRMGFLVDKTNQGMGMRSWRYSMVVTDGVVENMFVEPGMCDQSDNDPFVVSDAETMVNYLKEARKQQEMQTQKDQPVASTVASTTDTITPAS